MNVPAAQFAKHPLQLTSLSDTKGYKFEFLAQFLVHNFSHPVVYSLVLLLYQFDVFAYNGINCFII